MYVCIHDVCMYVYTHSLTHTHMYRLRDLFFKRDALEALTSRKKKKRLRDLLFKKDALEALTSAEFAMTLDTSVLGNCQLFFLVFFFGFLP